MNSSKCNKERTPSSHAGRILQMMLLQLVVLAVFVSSTSSFPDDKTKKQKHQKLQIGLKCLSFEKEMDDILSSTQQVYIAAPAKAAGTSMGAFVGDYCMKDFDLAPERSNGDKDYNYFSSNKKIKYIKMHNKVFPSVLSSHVWNSNTMIDLVRDSTDDTLLIYMHRPETERLLSAVKDVAFKLCHPKCKKHFSPERIHYDSRNRTCLVEESLLFDIVQEHKHEIGVNLQRALNCSFFDAIQQHTPKNMVIVHFRQSDEMMKSVAKHHCPEVLNQLPLKEIGKDKDIGIFVKLESDKSNAVSIFDWVVKKKHVLGLKHDWFDDYECQGKIREIEEKMFFSEEDTCIDELVQLVTIKNSDEGSSCTQKQTINDNDDDSNEEIDWTI